MLTKGRPYFTSVKGIEGVFAIAGDDDVGRIDSEVGGDGIDHELATIFDSDSELEGHEEFLGCCGDGLDSHGTKKSEEDMSYCNWSHITKFVFGYSDASASI